MPVIRSRLASGEPPVRTAVVIVHGMGEQLPVATLNSFVRTALPRPTGVKYRHYFSRPERVTDSYEARFGGPLRPLFGNGIVDHPVTGNKPGRFLPALAHTRYFSYPERLETDDMATVLRCYLQLNLDEDLIRSSNYPKADPATDEPSAN